MEATRLAVLQWLRYEDERQSPKKTSKNAFTALMALSADVPLETPKQPEILTRIWEARRFGVPVYTGDMDDYPAVARAEMNTALNAEQEHLAVKAKNLALKADFNAKHPV